MKQGSYGIAVRNPVYLKDKNEQEYFWGFTIVILRVPDIFSDSIHALSDFGYEYSELKKSEKFTPALYLENDGVWEGGSTSQFTPVMKFKLWERFSETGLEVAESMEVNGKRTFGYDVPILYKRA